MGDRDKTPEEIRAEARRELERIKAERRQDQESNQEDK